VQYGAGTGSYRVRIRVQASAESTLRQGDRCVTLAHQTSYSGEGARARTRNLRISPLLYRAQPETVKDVVATVLSGGFLGGRFCFGKRSVCRINQLRIMELLKVLAVIDRLVPEPI